MSELKLGKYQHYKGKYYEVIGIALDTETREKMVLYKCLYPVNDLPEEYGKDPIFTRSYDNFTENVEIKEQKVPRFKFIGQIKNNI
jgi:hypothetical protein